ncbi:MAG: cytochrome-c peroxidase [Hyphomicrobiaceae bacterium]
MRQTPISKVQATLLAATLLTAAVGLSALANPPRSSNAISTVEQLGEALFFDTNLSRNRTQACATCHVPDAGFVDPRELPATGRAVSLGDDGHSLGDRNAPTVTYAHFSPKLHINAKGRWDGGLFHDGRAATLEEQAAGPPLNPVEMGMPDKAGVVTRIKENERYRAAFPLLFGANVFGSADTAYAAMARAIAAYERTDTFAPFDSKYDRYLRGEAKLTRQEELGRVLFFAPQFANCSQCHKLHETGGAEGETFTNYEFHNIGVPPNTAVRAVNGKGKTFVDRGLLDNTAVTDPAQEGKFRTPTLRNVAVTGPYMHNGVFKDLRTVILFYNKYVSRNPARQINPETGQPWAAPEVPRNLSLKELHDAPALDDRRVNALVAFLRTLTDKRYEHLLGEPEKTGRSASRPASERH